MSDGEPGFGDDGPAFYVGLPRFGGVFARRSWGSRGEPLSALRLLLQLLGVMVVSPAYVRAANRMAKVRHGLSLLYVLAWQVGLWGALTWATSLVVASGDRRPPPFLQAVQLMVLLSAALSHLLCAHFFAGYTPLALIDIAEGWCFVRCWEHSVNRTGVVLACLTLLLNASAWLEGSKPVAALVALGWMLLMVLVVTLAMVVRFCTFGLDAFALNLLNARTHCGLSGTVGQFNLLSAAIRRAAYSMQALVATVLALTMALGIAALCHVAWFAAPGRWAAGDAVAVAWVSFLLLTGLWLLNEVAVVNLKCKRLPALVHSLDFGREIDHDRWCVAAHIHSSDANFPVHGVVVDRGTVLKSGYLTLAGICLLVTRLAVSNGE